MLISGLLEHWSGSAAKCGHQVPNRNWSRATVEILRRGQKVTASPRKNFLSRSERRHSLTSKYEAVISLRRRTRVPSADRRRTRNVTVIRETAPSSQVESQAVQRMISRLIRGREQVRGMIPLDGGSRSEKVSNHGGLPRCPTNPSRVAGVAICAFSVRGLIVVVLVIGLGLGWIVRGADAARGGGGDHERRRPGNIRTAIQESRG